MIVQSFNSATPVETSGPVEVSPDMIGDLLCADCGQARRGLVLVERHGGNGLLSQAGVCVACLNRAQARMAEWDPRLSRVYIHCASWLKQVRTKVTP